MVSLYVPAADSSDGTADKTDYFCCSWKIVMAPLQNTTTSQLPTKMESPLFSGGLGNELYPTTNRNEGYISTDKRTGGECVQNFRNNGDD